MIKVTADIFSGRPNPEWVVSGDEAEATLRSLAQRPTAAAALDSGFQGLGNRGLIVELLDDHAPQEHGVPAKFRLAGGAGDASYARESAERLLRSLTKPGAAEHSAVATAPGQLPLDETLRKYVLDTLPNATALRTHSTVPAHEEDKDLAAKMGLSCSYETTAFNPAFWNDPAHITKNNCYNYATNRRTDTFAQPGRASGHMYTQINCSEVCNGALSDGATLSCAPDAQKPRWYMALVIAPGLPPYTGFHDYHWYRKATEGFWGHKPGGTAARNYDNNGPGHLVLDPRTANRGPYTIFCSFVYAQAKIVVK